MPTEGGEQHDLLVSESLSLTVARLRLQIAPEYPRPRADHLRAAVASLKPEIDLLHQYGSEGLIYRYPRVLYQVADREPMIVAVEEGIEVLSALTLVGADLRLGASTHRGLGRDPRHQESRPSDPDTIDQPLSVHCALARAQSGEPRSVRSHERRGATSVPRCPDCEQLPLPGQVLRSEDHDPSDGSCLRAARPGPDGRASR